MESYKNSTTSALTAEIADVRDRLSVTDLETREEEMTPEVTTTTSVPFTFSDSEDDEDDETKEDDVVVSPKKVCKPKAKRLIVSEDEEESEDSGSESEDDEYESSFIDDDEDRSDDFESDDNESDDFDSANESEDEDAVERFSKPVKTVTVPETKDEIDELQSPLPSSYRGVCGKRKRATVNYCESEDEDDECERKRARDEKHFPTFSRPLVQEEDPDFEVSESSDEEEEAVAVSDETTQTPESDSYDSESDDEVMDCTTAPPSPPAEMAPLPPTYEKCEPVPAVVATEPIYEVPAQLKKPCATNDVVLPIKIKTYTASELEHMFNDSDSDDE